MNKIIKTRVESIFNHIDGKYTVLPDEVVRSFVEKLRYEFITSADRISKKNVNVADLSSEDIKKYLNNLSVDKNIEIFLMWIPYRSGIVVPFHIFIDNFDEFWYPASEDIFLANEEMNWLLYVDHEENVTFYVKTAK